MSRSKLTRSVRRQWPTSEIPCGPNACVRYARFALGLPAMAADTAATQWFERTLDDSACRRLYLPQAFLAADAVLRIALNLANGLIVNRDTIAKNVREHLPYMLTENLMMAAVAAGASRQDVHEVVRMHSHAVTERIKRGEGSAAELLDRLSADPAFAKVDVAASATASTANFVGRARNRSCNSSTSISNQSEKPMRRCWV